MLALIIYVHRCYHNIIYCWEIWGNTYKNRIQPPIILNIARTKTTRTIADLVKFKSMSLMYNIYNNLMPSNIRSYFCMVHVTHDHDTRQAGHFKNVYCRTTLKSMCLSIRGPVMRNKLHTDLNNSTNVNMFNKCIKPFWLVSMQQHNL